MADDDDPIWAVPGFEELHDEWQLTSDRARRKASWLANIVAGLHDVDDSTREKAISDYRELAEKAVRAREIRDQCYQGYTGDYEY